MKRIICLILSVIMCAVALPAGAFAQTPSVSAKGAVMINAATGTVLFEKNAYSRLPMASTTKIMTALLLAEQPDLDKIVVTTKEMVTTEGSSMGLQEGDSVTYHDLIYGMLLASGNDAANTTAIALDGSVERFVKRMNKKAAELGLEDTNFVTPSGLDDEQHYTTAYDLARLAAFALENPIFYDAASSRSATLCYGNPPYNRTLSNHNKLLSMYDDCIGVKTGFTKKSGRCLVSAAERDGVQLIAVTLNDGDDWNDHINMLDFGFEALQCRTVTPNIPADIPVVGGTRERAALFANDVSLPLLEKELGALVQKVYINRFVYAPTEVGEVIGRVDICYGEKILASSEIRVSDRVERIESTNKKDIFYYIKLLLSV